MKAILEDEETWLRGKKPLANYMVQKYLAYDHYDDLIAVVNLGILEAHRTYDPAKGTAPDSHAFNCARYSLQKHIRQNCGFRDDRSRKLVPAIPTVELNVDLLVITDDFHHKVLQSDILQEALAILSGIQYKVIATLYIESWSVPELAKHMDLSKQRIYQIKNEALQKMHHYLLGIGVDAEILRAV